MERDLKSVWAGSSFQTCLQMVFILPVYQTSCVKITYSYFVFSSLQPVFTELYWTWDVHNKYISFNKMILENVKVKTLIKISCFM